MKGVYYSITGNYYLLHVKITAANGLQIPFIGYYEPTIRIFGREVREAGFLIVKDPEDLYLANRKHAVPGVVGSNIFNVLANNPNDFDKNEIPVATEMIHKQIRQFTRGDQKVHG